MIKDKYLPLGTVVMLKKGKKRVMIIGYEGVAIKTSKKRYDYIACIYPNGLIDKDKMILFDHVNIETIYFEGYSDEEDIVYKERLKEYISFIKDREFDEEKKMEIRK